jgi:hypothetical protein
MLVELLSVSIPDRLPVLPLPKFEPTKAEAIQWSPVAL